MKTDKKLKIIFLVFALFLLVCPQIIFAGPRASLPIDLVSGEEAVRQGLDLTAATAGVSGGETDLPKILGKIINYLFGIVAVIFLTITLVGGFLWMTAGGNEENMKKAKSFIINGINGMIVIFLAYALVYVILYSLNLAIGGQAK